MPCTCNGYPEPEPDTHNGPLAEALCKVLREHEARGEMSCFDPPTLEWWEVEIAAAELGIDPKRLRGYLFRNKVGDPGKTAPLFSRNEAGN